MKYELHLHYLYFIVIALERKDKGENKGPAMVGGWVGSVRENSPLEEWWTQTNQRHFELKKGQKKSLYMYSCIHAMVGGK